MNNLVMALILFLVSCIALFAGFHTNNRATAFMLTLGSIIYLGASIWKLILFGIWIVKWLI